MQMRGLRLLWIVFQHDGSLHYIAFMYRADVDTCILHATTISSCIIIHNYDYHDHHHHCNYLLSQIISLEWHTAKKLKEHLTTEKDINDMLHINITIQ